MNPYRGEAPPKIGPSNDGVPPVIGSTQQGAMKRLFRKVPLARPPLLLPEELERFKNLLVFAKSTVEGYYSGKHKSPFRGSSVEFTDYKEYTPGDDVNRIDWRAYGRTRRLFVRQYEAETDMTVYLVVDTSASMRYAGGARQSKYLIAAKIAATLAYLMINQGDKTSLVLASDRIRDFLPAGGTRRHLHNIITSLERVEPASTTGLGKTIQECDPLFRKRGRIVVISDFWTDLPALFDALGIFIHRNFEVLLLQLLDPDELTLPGTAMAKFQDLESGERIDIEVESIRRDYQKNIESRVADLAEQAAAHQIQHALANTSRPYLEAIEAYLGFRSARLAGGHGA